MNQINSSGGNFSYAQLELIRRQAKYNDIERSLNDIVQEANLTGTIDYEKIEGLTEQLIDTARENMDYLVDLCDSTGYPFDTLVGDEAAEAAWNIVTSAPPESVDAAKKVLKAITAGGSYTIPELSDVMMLEDSILVSEGFPQKYGSVWFSLPGPTACIIPSPIDDIANVDARRKAFGSNETLYEYGLRVQAEYGVEPHFPLDYVKSLAEKGDS